ncbi:MAG: transcriptional regulator [Treponema sp.]|jgi:hypothetical protein|nr:transcriptional regulator [Treponema sp.]
MSQVTNWNEYDQAAQDFNRARNRATLSRIQHFINPDRDNLLSFNDVKGILKPKNEVYRGMREVPINKIVGSEGRYRDFNKFFLPRSEFLRNRWESIDRAKIRDIPLPAIRLYEIGGVYFVRDGNHRVSVARSQGGEEIDAEVTSLATEVEIHPSMTVDELKAALIEYEKKIFYEKTSFGELTGDMKMSFTDPGCYDVIYNHILVHKYYLNQNHKDELPFEKALISWYKNVYLPIIKIIDEEMLSLNFPGRSPGDLYVWIVKHWHYLKKENGVHYSVADAARDFSMKYGNSNGRFFRFLAVILTRFFKKHE